MVTQMCCDECKYYNWYYDHCEKWDCSMDAREVHDCFESVNIRVQLSQQSAGFGNPRP